MEDIFFGCFGIIFFTSITIISVIVHYKGKDANTEFIEATSLFSGIVSILLSTLIITSLWTKGDKPKYPNALDVYRGNTTLEITYRDSIPLDTTVVWKVK